MLLKIMAKTIKDADKIAKIVKIAKVKTARKTKSLVFSEDLLKNNKAHHMTAINISANAPHFVFPILTPFLLLHF